MRNVVTIMKKELKSYWNSPIAYIFVTVFLGFVSWFFFRGFFLEGQASLRAFFPILPWAFVVFVPAVTMRLWAEEKKLGTIELLMTLPLRDHEVVVGKYLAALVFLSFTILLSFPLFLIVRAMGSPDLCPIVGGYAGSLLLGAAFLAIGIFISSLTENQIIAFVISFVVAFFLQILDADVVLSSVPEAIAPLVSFLGASAHFESVERGVIDSRDLLYFGSVIAFFLYLNVRTIESRKWA